MVNIEQIIYILIVIARSSFFRYVMIGRLNNIFSDNTLPFFDNFVEIKITENLVQLSLSFQVSLPLLYNTLF